MYNVCIHPFPKYDQSKKLKDRFGLWKFTTSKGLAQMNKTILTRIDVDSALISVKFDETSHVTICLLTLQKP